MKGIEVLAAVFLVEVIGICLIQSYLIINIQTVITILIFNSLFASLIFQLRGNPIKKLSILTLGSLVGFLCNLLFFNFSTAAVQYFGDEFSRAFGAFYNLIFPFLNLIWIVPFWSFTLSVLVEHNPSV